MNARTALLAVFGCAMLGGWLPSLWLSPPPEKARRPLPALPPPGRAPVPSAVAAAVRAAGTPMAKLQAVVKGLAGRHIDFSFRPSALGDLDSDTAYEFASALAGESLGRTLTDGTAFLELLKSERLDYTIGIAALEAWAERDPDAALTALLGPSSGTGTGFYLSSGLPGRLAARDPDKMLAMLKAAPPLPHVKEVWEKAFPAFVEKGEEFALAAIRSAPAAVRERGVACLFASLVAKDPDAALAWRETLPPELREGAWMSILYAKRAETGPAAAFDESQGTNRPLYLDEPVFRNWAAAKPEEFVSWALAKDKPEATGFLALLGDMADNDPQRMLSVLHLVPADLQKSLLDRIGKSRAAGDPAAALAWAKSLPAEDRPSVLKAMAPALTGLPSEELRIVAAEMGVNTFAGFQVLMQADRAEAEAVLTAMPPETARDIRQELARSLASASPAEAAALLEPLMEEMRSAAAPSANPGRHGLSSVVDELTRAWGRRDPAAASAWVAGLPEGPSQVAAATGLAQAWIWSDISAARAWVEQLPAGEAHDRAAEQIIRLTKSSGG